MFGHRAGQAAARHAGPRRRRARSTTGASGGGRAGSPRSATRARRSPPTLKAALAAFRDAMWLGLGIVRTEAGLGKAAAQAAATEEHGGGMRPRDAGGAGGRDRARAPRRRGSRRRAASAPFRTESRAAHYREDSPRDRSRLGRDRRLRGRAGVAPAPGRRPRRGARAQPGRPPGLPAPTSSSSEPAGGGRSGLARADRARGRPARADRRRRGRPGPDPPRRHRRRPRPGPRRLPRSLGLRLRPARRGRVPERSPGCRRGLHRPGDVRPPLSPPRPDTDRGAGRLRDRRRPGRGPDRAGRRGRGGPPGAAAVPDRLLLDPEDRPRAPHRHVVRSRHRAQDHPGGGVRLLRGVHEHGGRRLQREPAPGQRAAGHGRRPPRAPHEARSCPARSRT